MPEAVEASGPVPPAATAKDEAGTAAVAAGTTGSASAAVAAAVVKRPPIREDLKVMLSQSQEADNTFITSDGTSPYNSTR
jgi:hypothetical protein